MENELVACRGLRRPTVVTQLRLEGPLADRRQGRSLEISPGHRVDNLDVTDGSICFDNERHRHHAGRRRRIAALQRLQGIFRFHAIGGDEIPRIVVAAHLPGPSLLGPELL